VSELGLSIAPAWTQIESEPYVCSPDTLALAGFSQKQSLSCFAWGAAQTMGDGRGNMTGGNVKDELWSWPPLGQLELSSKESGH
jgi:hypothetical protein